MVDYLIAENAKSAEETAQASDETSESMEITDSDIPKEPTPFIFTHEETIDYVGYYFNKALQNMTGEYTCLKTDIFEKLSKSVTSITLVVSFETGERSIFFSCHGKVFGKNRKVMMQYCQLLEMETYSLIFYAISFRWKIRLLYSLCINSTQSVG